MFLESSVVVTPPTVEPITVDSVKAWGRISSSDEDTLVQDLITQAREEAERRTNRSLASQTIQATFSQEEKDNFIAELPFPPVQSISLVEYRASQWDTWVTLETENYFSDLSSEPGKIKFPSSYDWYRVTFIAGYSNFPQGLKKLLLSLVLYWYDNRDMPVPTGLQQDLMSYRSWSV